jgi:DNA adenine methylase
MIKSFLKWAGGKSRILEQIQSHIPNKINRYIEPFLGSGVVLLNVDCENKIGADENKDLIHTFITLRDNTDELIERCKWFFEDGNNPCRYYKLRKRFNYINHDVDKAALFIYLNRHDFNGLCRYNSSGDFNVPFGRYNKITLPEDEMRVVADKIKPVKFISGSVFDLFDSFVEGDVVYCDPPYFQLHTKKTKKDTEHYTVPSFQSYTSSSFSMSEQIKLVELAKEGAKQGATIIISNHDTPEMKTLYEGHIVSSFSVQRHISAKERNKSPELIAIYKK